ncbi:hypothetical protein M501DRAFT_1004189 [Patellaria atrata CBS 101060]|uniref:Uncharacterized protein n=1 Tax=Patellaria atrata CBS 101060 TaxID=1346257 RepID=A0A9P4S9I2_9PEZI|nr:hypothetical protein M501DRAFT_1004189 [Patellaria atrata CBS 101060]
MTLAFPITAWTVIVLCWPIVVKSVFEIRRISEFQTANTAVCFLYLVGHTISAWIGFSVQVIKCLQDKLFYAEDPNYGIYRTFFYVLLDLSLS